MRALKAAPSWDHRGQASARRARARDSDTLEEHCVANGNTHVPKRSRCVRTQTFVRLRSTPSRGRVPRRAGAAASPGGGKRTRRRTKNDRGRVGPSHGALGGGARPLGAPPRRARCSASCTAMATLAAVLVWRRRERHGGRWGRLRRGSRRRRRGGRLLDESLHIRRCFQLQRRGGDKNDKRGRLSIDRTTALAPSRRRRRRARPADSGTSRRVAPSRTRSPRDAAAAAVLRWRREGCRRGFGAERLVPAGNGGPPPSDAMRGVRPVLLPRRERSHARRVLAGDAPASRFAR